MIKNYSEYKDNAENTKTYLEMKLSGIPENEIPTKYYTSFKLISPSYMSDKVI